MQTKIKRKILISLSAVLFAFCGVLGVNLVNHNPQAKAATATPTITIEKHNLSYADSVYILYAVSNEGFDRTQNEIKMLFWEDAQDEYAVGTESYSATNSGNTTIGEKSCLVFYSAGIAAKEMTDDVYCRAYAEIDGVAYYSELSKFSVLEYVYSMKETGNLTEAQELAFNALLNYGGAMQALLGYKTDRPANATYYKISVENGTLVDGTAMGRFLLNEAVTLTADPAPDGYEFAYWADELGASVSENESLEIIVTESKTYTAVYEKWTENLKFRLLGDETYSVSGYAGTDTRVVIPSKYEGKAVTKIASQAFQNCDILISINIPKSVTSIESQAFYGCYRLKHIKISNNETRIGSNAFSYCGLEEIVLPENLTSIDSGTFSHCNFTSLVIPTRVTSLEYAAFYGCGKLKSIVLPNNLTSIGGHVFYCCSQLKNIVIPKTVLAIGEFTFTYCNNLTIYCEVESQPEGWDSNWNSSNRPVYWYSENEPALNSDGTAYDGNYWKYDENGEIYIWKKETV